MKTKFSFSKKTHTSLLVATATLLLLSMQSAIFAGSATWLATPVDGNWLNNNNWNPNPGFPNGSSDVATFGVSNTTGVSITSAATITVFAIHFNSGASSFTITVDPARALNISAAVSPFGINNDSGITQNFVTAVDGSGDHGTINFTNSATAGSMTS